MNLLRIGTHTLIAVAAVLLVLCLPRHAWAQG